MRRPDVEDPWLFARCREIQENPNGYLDLWAREHYKSTIITFAKSIQDILASHGEDPLPIYNGREVTLGIFSFNRGIALDFVQQIKYELENNRLLRDIFPDILFADEHEASRLSPSWSVMGGLTVRRESNPRECTLEGWGLVDSMPTGSHFFGRIYDDVITEKFARSTEMIAKATESWELSLNLGARGGFERYIGTRYNYNDTYRTIMKRDAAVVRLYPATDDGTMTGKPVYLTDEELRAKRKKMGPYVFGCQMLQDPKADEVQGFKLDWFRFYQYDDFSPEGMNIYIICDPANEKKKSQNKDPDYTALGAIGFGPDGNKYLIDYVRDRLNLKERTAALMAMHRAYHRPMEGHRVLGVGYERYGKDSDIQHIEEEQARQNYRFDIQELGGTMHKNDRIRRLIPDAENGIWYLPDHLYYTDYQNMDHDLVEELLNEEIEPFPMGAFDDGPDMMSRIYDMNTVVPQQTTTSARSTRRKRKSRWLR